MALHRIGRDDDDHHLPPYPTEVEDDDEMPETPSFVDKLPLETPSSPYFEEPTEAPSFVYPYPSKQMSYGSDRNTERPWPTWPLSWLTEGGSRGNGPYQSPQTSTTLVISRTAYGDHNGLQSSTATMTPTLIPTDGTSPPTPPDDDSPGLQNNAADNGPNRTPIYAAAGIVPVVVVIVGFFVFFCLRRRRRQKQAVNAHGHIEEMKMQPKPVMLPYIAPPSPPPAVLPHYSPSSSHPSTASSLQPVILGPIPSGTNGAYLTGMDTSDVVSMTSASNISRMGTVVDRDPFADGRSLEEAPPPYRPSSLPPVSLASTSRNSSVRIAAPHTTSRTQLIERSPFDDPEDDEISELSETTPGGHTDAMSDVSNLSYQIDPVVGRSPF
jgi:hypothetical protein